MTMPPFYIFARLKYTGIGFTKWTSRLRYIDTIPPFRGTIVRLHRNRHAAFKVRPLYRRGCRNMPHFMQPDEQTTRLTNVPSDLPILPLRSTLAYPFSVMPLAIGIPRSMRLIEEALQGDRLLGLVGM